MFETLQDAHGVGLAANQVGVLKRIAVIQTSLEDEPIYIINPEITEMSGEREVEEFGRKKLVISTEKQTRTRTYEPR